MLVVQKYGGATLADPSKIKAVAQRVKASVARGDRVVVIVSAMGQTTNQLLELAQSVAKQPELRELDMLLSAGERMSMSLVAIALNDCGVPAISFTGSQAGIMTNDSHLNALITDVRAFRVTDSLRDGKVVVLAGYQGVSPTRKEVTTLGRGGTDTTAVAMAVHLRADRCEILKEVPAVFTADPRVVPAARPLARLSYEALAHSCFWGAKVLHYRSVELAAYNKVPLFVGPAHNVAEGTFIDQSLPQEQAMYESVRLLSLNSFEKVLQLSTTEASGFDSLSRFLEQNKIGWPQILAVHRSGSETRFDLTGPAEILSGIEKSLPSQKAWKANGTFAAVTATCLGSVAPELTEKILSCLDRQKIPFDRLQHTAMGITVFLPSSERAKALTELHKLIEA